MRRSQTKTLTLTALLTAAALIVFVIEAQLPPLTAIQGIKPGLSNVFTLFALYALGPGQALAVFLVRAVLGNLVTGQAMAIAYSLAGGLLAFLAMAVAKRWIGEGQMWVTSVFGAIFHNIGQLAAALFLLSTPELIWYLPILLIAAIPTGAFTGLCAQMVLGRLRKGGFI